MLAKYRIPIRLLQLSMAGLTALLAHEAFMPTAYPDPTYGWKIPTIGYGTTEGVKRGDTITKEVAQQRVLAHVRKDMKTLNKCIGSEVRLTQIEYDLLVDFVYNVGTTAFCKSTMRRKLNQFDYAGAWDEYPKWHWSNGRDCRVDKKCTGVYTRRLKAQRLAKEQLL